MFIEQSLALALDSNNVYFVMAKVKSYVTMQF